MLRIKFMTTSYEIALGWMPQDTFDDVNISLKSLKCKNITVVYLKHGAVLAYWLLWRYLE